MARGHGLSSSFSLTRHAGPPTRVQARGVPTLGRHGGPGSRNPGHATLDRRRARRTPTCPDLPALAAAEIDRGRGAVPDVQHRHLVCGLDVHIRQLLGHAGRSLVHVHHAGVLQVAESVGKNRPFTSRAALPRT